ncbi:MAG: TonB-dependent receptor, partial [Rudaea sp.]|nr:TonB-dependent receptor [Rudaea sp.]
ARIGGGVRYVGERVTTVTHSPLALPLGAYEAVDLNADIANDRWTVRLFVKNLTNKGAYLSATPLTSALTGAIVDVRATPLQPRVIGVGFDVKL